MDKETRPPGITTIAPDVLLSIARLTALKIDGVNRMATVPVGVERLWQRSHVEEGVRISIEDKIVHADVYVVMNKNVNIREVSRNIQQAIARAVEEMVGMVAGHINIHIEDIQYDAEGQG